MSAASRSYRAPAPRFLLWWVWLATFAYAALAAGFVQLVVLPHFLPAWHAGRGLLVGGDWVAFDIFAVQRAALIRTQGWGVFELRPHGNAPSGIASAIYALTWPEPWTLIPLNATLHATAAALLCHLLRGFVTDWRPAVIGTGPFVLYPTALVWISQLHKEGIFIVGYLCLFVAGATLVRLDAVVGRWHALGRTLLLIPVGFGMVWLVRPDFTLMAHATVALALGVLAARITARIWRDPPWWRSGIALLTLAVLTTLASAWLTSAESRFLREREPFAPQARIGAERPFAPTVRAPRWDELTRAVRAMPWYRSAWLPAEVDRMVYRIALTREVFLVFYLDAQSAVDTDVGFYRAADLFRYVPRALQIALLAPFPSRWQEGGSLNWTTAGRRVVAVEMLGVYVALLSLLVVVWRWRRRAELWVVVLPCLGILSAYGVVVPNLGAVHRFRYGFLMTLVGLGLAGGLDLLRQRAARARARSR